MTRLQHMSFMHSTTVEEFIKSVCVATLCQCRDPRDSIFAFISLLPAQMDAKEVKMLKTSGFSLASYAGASISSSLMNHKNYILGESAVKVSDDSSSRCKGPEVDQVDGLQVNYNSSAKAVIINVAIVLLTNLGLGVLSAMQGHETIGEMPTWVPD
jgi:hypothetical protein